LEIPNVWLRGRTKMHQVGFGEIPKFSLRAEQNTVLWLRTKACILFSRAANKNNSN
jgi:hypothetical protein